MRATRIRLLGAVLAAINVTGCFAGAHRSSPWEYGGGVRVAPGFVAGDSSLTVHPMASFTYLSFDGGHDELYELGGQVRKRISAASKLWVGAEAAGAIARSEEGPYSESSNGWSLTGLVGAPVGQSRWGVNLYGGAGISNYGSAGINVRVGIDLQPWFLKR